DVAAGMCFYQVAVIDLLGAGFQRTFIQERLRRPRRLRPRLLVTLVRWNPVIRRHPLAGPVVGGGGCAPTRAKLFVSPLLEVVEGMKERLDLRGCCEPL